MHSFDELELRWQALSPLPKQRGTVRLIVLRKGGGIHETPVAARLKPECGVEGDRWIEGEARHLPCQVTMMMTSVAELVVGDDAPLHQPGDNFLVDLDLSEESLPAGTRLGLGGAIVEVSPHPHAGCSKFAARFGPEALRWVNFPEHRSRRLRGVNCQVIEAGDVRVGDEIRHVPHTDHAGWPA